MAIAPMQTVRDALTKALTNVLSLAFPVLTFSHCPSRSNAPSMFSASPITAPMARHPMISSAPLLTTFPSCTVSIPSMAPEMAINSVPTPQTFISVSCALWLRTRPNNAPHTPPARIAAVLMTVPSPTMCFPSFPDLPKFYCILLKMSTRRRDIDFPSGKQYTIF